MLTRPDTERIERFNANYLQLAQYGLFVHDLKGYYTRGARWEVQVSRLVDIPDDIAKAAIANWLEKEYQATDYYFYRRTSDKDNQFRCQFNRGDC